MVHDAADLVALVRPSTPTSVMVEQDWSIRWVRRCRLPRLEDGQEEVPTTLEQVRHHPASEIQHGIESVDLVIVIAGIETKGTI